jgi:hypothetical protein
MDEASDTQIMQMLPTIRGDHTNINQLYQCLEKKPSHSSKGSRNYKINQGKKNMHLLIL